ncbi:hypothetical protein AKJ37_00515 [candidate division MSBL1 archaeon SCGC-AAA259I09]|uniref:2-phosphosulfolactate phosphatase n=2 Tax=candidate division MSBL1 TaxID=215777 RepID=A0A133UVW2_9EURY|nr:hypothetical protein AKJ37_00515 [candidate division MSBL1 archaeon SCGC-AAA259I09]KXA98569.1 hypothetical protein AKJ39_01635 [candidate division MSBL1 archaeon SCGC-AAA259J03]
MKVKVSIGKPESIGSVVVLVDVIRSSTAIAIALKNGAKYVLPFKDTEDALKAKDRLNGQEDVILAGEEYGEKPEGFDITNSPSNMTREFVEDKVIIYRSSNLTRVLAGCKSADELLIGGIVNSGAISDYINSMEPEEIEIVACGISKEEATYLKEKLGIYGDEGSEITIEDIIGTGSILSRLDFDKLSDIGIISLMVYNNPQWREEVRRGRIAHLLRHLNLEEDLEHCLEENQIDIVPLLKDDRIIPLSGTDY